MIGKKDFKGLLRWRESLRIDLGYAKSRKAMEEEKKLQEKESAATQETEETLAEKIAEEARLVQVSQKKAKKKQKEKKMKHLLKLRLGMDTPNDIGLEASTMVGIGEQDFDFGTSDLLMINSKNSENGSDQESASESEAYDSDEEQQKKMAGLETEIDGL